MWSLLHSPFASLLGPNIRLRILFSNILGLHSSHIVRLIGPRTLRWAVHVVRMEEFRSAFKILTGTPAGEGPLGRPRRRWEDNIIMGHKEIGINTRNWVDSAQDRDYSKPFS